MKPKNAIDIAGATDAGRVRRNNEDSFIIDAGLGLLVVADGMGGHNSGEVASALATATILEGGRKIFGKKNAAAGKSGPADVSPRARQLEALVKAANVEIFNKGRALAQDAGMGTTVVAAIMDEKSISVAHVGDSRLYLWRQGALTQLTQDHSLVGEQVRRGQITPEAAARSSLQNILTRALGSDDEVSVDVADHPLLAGDVVLLVSDGITKMLTDEEISAAVAAAPDSRRVVVDLISKAVAAGGVDNVTVVAARVPARRQAGVRKFMARLFGR